MRRLTAAPSFRGWRFCALFRQVALAGKFLPILWLILFDLGRSWKILADLVIFSICRWKKCCLQTSVQKGRAISTTDPSKWRSDQNGTTIDHKWDQSGSGAWQGVPTNQQQYEKIKKTQTQSTNMRCFFWCAAISSKIGGLNGWAFTNVLWNKNDTNAV